VPPCSGEARGSAGQGLPDRHAIQDREPVDSIGVVHREAESDVAAPVVPDDREALVPQPTHEFQDVRSQSPLRRLRMIGPWRRRGRAAIAAQIRTDDGMPGRNQQRRHGVPGGVRTGVPVQQHHRRAATSYADPQPYTVVDVDPAQREALEHVPILLA